MPAERLLHLVTEDEQHRVTTLELFFDLVFVYAITQTTQLMSDNPTLLGLGQGLAMLAVLWWCWCSYTWLGNTVHADRGVARFAMLAAMAAMFVVSLAIPEAFTDAPGGLFTPLLFLGCYLLVRVLHLLAYYEAARADPALRRVLVQVAPSMLAGTGVLAVGAFTSGAVQLGLWVLGLVVDYTGVYLSGSKGWRISAPGHFAERFGLIVMIALGESIVSIGIGISHLPLTWPIVVTALCGLGVAVSLWWLYFDVVAHSSEHRLASAQGAERAKLATDTYTYLHLPLIAGVMLVALGLKKVLLHVADTAHYLLRDPLHGMPLWALTGGTALYLGTLSAIRRRNLGRWNVQRLVSAALLLVATPLLGLVPAAAALAAVLAACLGVVTFERLRFGPLRTKLLGTTS
ncbi:low temperature requirement protein A [Amycolatopsis rhizosphaerae]|uniref:Low temperature requirement protein A n=1 Tax=Amycolatopsis rhizosphaerae TaxID=2053003 RepID=A0A558D8E0_9PSEU|nr:low temperature requirement protein A [Amycolatopsis rhizosphaerae]TVT57299.1 low temperature requirement protein A [Amycolatopsis rhizosphaerae]